jgi:hypothetical protein
MINGHPVPLPLFLVIFAASWLAMSFLLDGMTGWPALQRRYPEIKEDQLPIRGFSAAWGGALSRRGSLMVSAGRSGLRVTPLKLFAPFSRPITGLGTRLPHNVWVAVDARSLPLAPPAHASP